MSVARYVLFSGANERAVIAVCRVLRQSGALFSIIGRPGSDPLGRTRYRLHFDVTRRLDTLDRDDMLACVAQLSSRFPDAQLHFLPTTESVNRLVLANQASFQAAGLFIDMVGYDTYARISDKASFLQLAETFELHAPETIHEPSWHTLPCVAKPLHEYSVNSAKRCYPYLLHSVEQLREFSASVDTADYFFQRYVDGTSFYYLLWMEGRGGAVKVAFQRNLLQQENGKSIVLAELCACPDREFLQKLLAMLEFVQYRGFIMVEAMMENDRSYLIEANPRLWGPFALAMQTPLAEVFRRRGEVQTASEYLPTRPVRYLWLGGLLGTFARGHRPRSYLGNRSIGLLEWFRFLAADIYLNADSHYLFWQEIRQAASLAVRRFFRGQSS